MKLNKYKGHILAAVLGLSIVAGPGCKKIKEFGDINQNPGQTTQPITSALLTNVLAGIGGTAANTRGGLYAQQFSETQYTETSLYAEPKVDFDGTYAGPLMDLQKIINFNTDPETAPVAAAYGSNKNQIATARILKAYYFWVMTDQYGDIPYSEALKGEGNTAFDTQQSIYNDLFKELKEAAGQFDGGVPFRGDIMYGGDVSKWKKFANSLRLVMALRLSKVDAAKGTSEANDAINSGVFTSNADNAVINYPGGAYQNPWYALYNGRKDFAMSDVIDNFLSATSDPRASVFGSSDMGFPYGLTRAQAVAFDGASGDKWARILDEDYRADNSPVTILSYAVVLLARAEARQRGWVTTGPTAQALYEAAIAASWGEWGISYTPAQLAAYYANSNVAFTAGNEIQRIAVQRWLALYPNGLQAWFEWRRTGFPVLTPSPNATNSSKQIPRRYVYGARQYSVNKANTEAAASRIGGDSQDTRVWWDKP
ncbi:MAG TPA: SusD/RagB family nutrient-binding outer membrane lipoprotein [Chitinophagaceae bacterium]